MSKVNLRVAKATERDFDNITSFVNSMDSLFDEFGEYEPESDKDKELIDRIAKEMDESKHDYGVILEFIRRKFKEANYCGSFRRVVFNAMTLIENCCDESISYLDFKPEIKYAERDALEKVKSIIKDGRNSGKTAEQIVEEITKHIEKENNDG